MPDNVTAERTQLLRMYGAEIVFSDGSKGSNGAVRARARDGGGPTRATTCPTSTATRQTRWPTTNGTALEILEELDEVSAFVAASAPAAR